MKTTCASLCCYTQHSGLVEFNTDKICLHSVCVLYRSDPASTWLDSSHVRNPRSQQRSWFEVPCKSISSHCTSLQLLSYFTCKRREGWEHFMFHFYEVFKSTSRTHHAVPSTWLHIYWVHHHLEFIVLVWKGVWMCLSPPTEREAIASSWMPCQWLWISCATRHESAWTLTSSQNAIVLCITLYSDSPLSNLEYLLTGIDVNKICWCFLFFHHSATISSRLLKK